MAAMRVRGCTLDGPLLPDGRVVVPQRRSDGGPTDNSRSSTPTTTFRGSSLSSPHPVGIPYGAILAWRSPHLVRFSVVLCGRRGHNQFDEAQRYLAEFQQSASSSARRADSQTLAPPGYMLCVLRHGTACRRMAWVRGVAHRG